MVVQSVALMVALSVLQTVGRSEDMLVHHSAEQKAALTVGQSVQQLVEKTALPTADPLAYYLDSLRVIQKVLRWVQNLAGKKVQNLA